MKARKKAKKAETTSCLNSDSDRILGKSNRIRQPNSRYSEYQSSEEENIIKPRRRAVPIPPSPPVPPSPPTPPTPPAPPTPQASSMVSLSRRPTVTPTELHIISQLEHLKEEVAVVKQLLLSLTNCTSPAAVLPEGICFPLNNLQDLEMVENRLKEEACYREMVKYLATIGGPNPSSNTRRILLRMLTTPLALQLCWRGSGQKVAFGEMLVCRAVIDAVTKSNRATASEAESSIKTWLRNARDRDGGRSKRTLRGLI
ncbi:uncharacterized protein [Paramormyrops kingsleyae]|uniref:uncharacterized protein n=1 Tax=Paramormyrops kingsleyae TaxID=1676925 RepID=UPI003B96AE00